MRVSSLLLFIAAAVCLLCTVSVVVCDPVIVTDLQSGLAFSLPSGYPGTLYDAQYDTVHHTYRLFANSPVSVIPTPVYPMTAAAILVNVTWAGDIEDDYSLVIPVGLTVTVVSGGSGCNVNSQTALYSYRRHCTYSLSWTAPFQGTFSVDYSNATHPVGSETIDITFIKPTSTISGDPQFVGLRGQSYQVHGIDGAVYNLITEQSTQVNSRFVFLSEGDCPVTAGVTAASSACWSHPGSYMGDMSFQAVVDGKLHTAYIAAGSAKQGFKAVQVDGKALKVGDAVSFGSSFSLSYNSTHSALVTVEHYTVELSNSDMFLNLALSARVPLSRLSSHGLIGQTHANKVYDSALRYIEGEVDDYAIADGTGFGTDFPHNLFQAQQ